MRFPAFCCFQSVFHVVSGKNTVPFTGKTSVICPVTPLPGPPPPPQKKKKKKKKKEKKKRNPSCLNDHCPIALSSIVLKCFERLILHQLMKHTKPHLDLYQFTYKHYRSTEDATLTLAYILILRKKVHLSELSSSTFLLPSVPYNHTSWQANV